MDVNVGAMSGKSTTLVSAERGASLAVNVLAGEKTASIRLPVKAPLALPDVTCCGTCAEKT